MNNGLLRHNEALALSSMTNQIVFPHQVEECAQKYGIDLAEIEDAFGSDEDDREEQNSFERDCNHGIERIDYIDYQ